MTPTEQNSETRRGHRYALLAFGTWGFFPIYWKLLKHIPPFEILLHRIFWSWIFYTIFQRVRTKTWTLGIKHDRKTYGYIFISALLITSNWLTYIYGVNSGQIIETSLGYFINPIFSIVLGVVFLREKLKRTHQVAFFLTLVGVAIFTYEARGIPILSLYLATSFSLYGFMRKKVAVSGVEGGQLESFMMILPVLAVFFATGNHLQDYSLKDFLLLAGAGFVTGMPLVWFADAAKRLPYFIMGFFQYLSPTLQFFTGVFIFHESITILKVLGFGFIWLAMLLLLATKTMVILKERRLKKPALLKF